jgi:hypothetical protein
MKEENFENYLEYKFFIIRCDLIPNKDLVDVPIPGRIKSMLEWSLRDKKNHVYDSVTIRDAIKYGYTVENITYGIYWNQSRPVFKEYIEKMFEMKKAADQEKKKALKAEAKLMLNGLFGKQIQRPICDVLEVCEQHDKEKILFLQEKFGIESFKVIGNKIYVYSKREYELKDMNKPYHLGVFILAYSKKIMNDYINKFDGFRDLESKIYYTDTDSLFITTPQRDKLLPYIGKELGQLAYELPEECQIVEAVFLQPKLYMIKYLQPSPHPHCYGCCPPGIAYKMCGKGISKEYLNEDFYLGLMDGEEQLIEGTNNFNRKNIKNNKHSTQSLDCFSIYSQDYTKVIKDNYSGKKLIGNEYVPVGGAAPYNPLL